MRATFIELPPFDEKNHDKRDIFAELIEGFGVLEASRTSRLTLRQHRVEYAVTPMLERNCFSAKS